MSTAIYRVSKNKPLISRTLGRGHDGWLFRRSGGPVFTLLLTVMLSGCATTRSDPYPYFERLTIEVVPPAAAEVNGSVPSAGETIFAGAAAGGVGSLSSGLLVSLLCGPFFVACLAGTGVATLGGAAVGAAIAGSAALSAEDEERVTRYLESLQQTHNLSEELAEAVTAQIPDSRKSGTADARLSLEAQGMRAQLGLEDKIALWLGVKSNLEWDLERTEPRHTSRDFACHTESLPLEDWLASGSTLAEQELTRCIDKLALEIATALQKPGPDDNSGPPIGFGSEDPATERW